MRGRRGLAAVRALWEARDSIAAERDVTPGRIIPDSAIVIAAQALPTDRATLLSTRGFHGRGAERYSSRWVAALREAAEMDEKDLPTRSPRGDGPPMPRAWAEKDPVAAKRLQLAREAMAGLAEEHHLPVENLLTPDYLRRTLWTPPAARQPGALLDAVAEHAGRVRRPQLADRAHRTAAHHGDPARRRGAPGDACRRGWLRLRLRDRLSPRPSPRTGRPSQTRCWSSRWAHW